MPETSKNNKGKSFPTKRKLKQVENKNANATYEGRNKRNKIVALERQLPMEAKTKTNPRKGRLQPKRLINDQTNNATSNVDGTENESQVLATQIGQIDDENVQDERTNRGRSSREPSAERSNMPLDSIDLSVNTSDDEFSEVEFDDNQYTSKQNQQPEERDPEVTFSTKKKFLREEMRKDPQLKLLLTAVLKEDGDASIKTNAKKGKDNQNLAEAGRTNDREPVGPQPINVRQSKSPRAKRQNERRSIDSELLERNFNVVKSPSNSTL